MLFYLKVDVENLRFALCIICVITISRYTQFSAKFVMLMLRTKFWYWCSLTHLKNSLLGACISDCLFVNTINQNEKTFLLEKFKTHVIEKSRGCKETEGLIKRQSF